MRKNTGNKQKQIHITVPVPEDVFEILRDVSLARHIAGIARKAGGTAEPASSRAKALETDGVAKIINDLIHHHREELEAEAVRAGIKKKKS